MIELLAAFLAGYFVRGWLAVGYERQRSTQIRNPHPMPATKPTPPPAPPWHRPVIDDPTLGPDQVMAINQLEVSRRAREAERSGWPT